MLTLDVITELHIAYTIKDAYIFTYIQIINLL